LLFAELPIPLIPATHSEGSRPAIPIESGHLFRSKAATCSDAIWPPCRSEATLVFDMLLIRQFSSSFLSLSH